MIYFLLAPERVGTCVEAPFGVVERKNRVKTMKIRERAADFGLDEGSGVHIEHYVDFMTWAVREFSDQKDFRPEPSTIMDWRHFVRIRSRVVFEALLKFTMDNYDNWVETCVQKPDYEEVDQRAHLEVCGSCPRREQCVHDCDSVDDRRYTIFTEGIAIDTITLRQKFKAYMANLSGRPLPELHIEYEPPRPDEPEEDPDGDNTNVPDAPPERGAEAENPWEDDESLMQELLENGLAEEDLL